METQGKKEKEKNKQRKRLEKDMKRKERKANAGDGSLETMMAYVDEFGQLTDEPIDPTLRKKISAESIEIGVPKRSDEPIDLTRRGKMFHYNEEKGYGFIKDSDTQESLFVHTSSLLEPISINDAVTFERTKTQRGWSATNVKKDK